MSYSWPGVSLLKQSFQLSDGAGLFWIIRKIRELMRVLLVVVKLDATFAIVPFRVTPPVRAHGPPHEPACGIAALHLRVGRAVPAQPGFVEQRPQARAREVFRRSQTAQIGDGWIDIQ